MLVGILRCVQCQNDRRKLAMTAFIMISSNRQKDGGSACLKLTSLWKEWVLGAHRAPICGGWRPLWFFLAWGPLWFMPLGPDCRATTTALGHTFHLSTLQSCLAAPMRGSDRSPAGGPHGSSGLRPSCFSGLRVAFAWLVITIAARTTRPSGPILLPAPSVNPVNTIAGNILFH